MTKVRVYLRIALNKGGRKEYKVAASTKADPEPLDVPGAYGRQTRLLPTVSFGIDLNIPDELFKQAERVIGEINVATSEATVGAEILIPALKKVLRENKNK